MKSDPHVSHIGNWYFRDVDGNYLPDFDTPYFYHDGDVINPLPFTLSMFRLRNLYFYSSGNIINFQLGGSGAGINFGKIYIIASNDVFTFNMMNMSMLDAGLVVIAGHDITNANMMSGSGIGTLTMWANNDIIFASGFNMRLATRWHLLAKNDIRSMSAMTGSFFQFSRPSAGCGAVCGSDETHEFSLGRRMEL